MVLKCSKVTIAIRNSREIPHVDRGKLNNIEESDSNISNIYPSRKNLSFSSDVEESNE